MKVFVPHRVTSRPSAYKPADQKCVQKTKREYVSVVLLHAEMTRFLEARADRVKRAKSDIDLLDKASAEYKEAKALISEFNELELPSYVFEASKYLNQTHELKNTFHNELVKIRKNREEVKALVTKYTSDSSRLVRSFLLNCCSPIADKYKEIDDMHVIEPTICESCGGELVVVRSQHVCVECGETASENLLADSAGTTNVSFEQRERVSVERKDTYRKINHFREFLRQLQGKSSATIPPKVMEVVETEFKKSHTKPEDITPDVVRSKLHKFRLSKYYEFSVCITLKLNPKFVPLNIKPEDEELMCYMFLQTLEPYESIKQKVRKNRKSYMSYPFVAYKLCQLNSFESYLPFFRLLKSNVLLGEQDRWWELVCKDLGWKFVRTVGNVAGNKDYGESDCL